MTRCRPSISPGNKAWASTAGEIKVARHQRVGISCLNCNCSCALCGPVSAGCHTGPREQEARPM